MAHQLDQFFCALSKAQSGRRGNQAFAAAHEEVRVKLSGKVMELQTYRTGRQVNLLRGAGHAGRVHDGKEEFELVNIHLPAPNTARCLGADACPELSAADFRRRTL